MVLVIVDVVEVQIERLAQQRQSDPPPIMPVARRVVIMA
jgi:hypothetical protein